MIKRLLLGMLIMVLVLPGAAQAQAQGTWQVTLFDMSNFTLYTVTPDSITAGVSFPQMATYTDISAYDLALSPDGRFLVFSTYETGPNQTEAHGVYVADTITGACCQKLSDPNYPTLQIILPGPISPDSRQIAVSMSSPYTESGMNDTVIATFDLETSAVTATLPLTSLDSEAFPGMVAQFGAWQEGVFQDGIRLRSSCWGCEPPLDGLFQIWNPVDGSVSAPTEPYNFFWDVLPATDGVVVEMENTAYPVSGLIGGMFATANVVHYYSTRADTVGRVIYYHPTNHVIYDAWWVQDGKTVLISQGGPVRMSADGYMAEASTPGEKYLLFRDGTQVAVTSTEIGEFLTGTPDGWLSFDGPSGTLYNNVVGLDAISNPLGTLGQPVFLNSNFVLGMSAGGSYPEAVPPVPVVCPGFVPSRLVLNSVAMVTPGEANNLRVEPRLSSAEAGSIPGGEAFIVLDGPVCADQMAWWRVDYRGTVGWTSEGQGSTYWLQPFMY
ncbi:MAG TPA: SH3 domain-containing protein [Aggregatilineaceae bacterium]|nr:SH3 domain-containing protein [Aggregatilineaceae bacterium]